MRRENPVPRLFRSLLPALVAGGCLVAAFPADAATLWRKRGPNGEWVYFDRPTAGAEPYELAVYTPGSAGNVPAARTSPPRASGGPTARERPPAAGGPPRTVEVLFPANDAVIQFADVSHLVARARVEPALNGGQQLWWVLNGQASRGEATEAALRALPRGSHSLQARVTDATGRTLLESGTVTFHIRQPSAVKPPVGPLLRKPRTP